MAWLAAYVALSAPGCWIAWRLLRRPALASLLPAGVDDADVLQFGYDSAGLFE